MLRSWGKAPPERRQSRFRPHPQLIEDMGKGIVVVMFSKEQVRPGKKATPCDAPGFLAGQVFCHRRRNRLARGTDPVHAFGTVGIASLVVAKNCVNNCKICGCGGHEGLQFPKSLRNSFTDNCMNITSVRKL
ncbi:MAG: hypothetical protein RL117_473 [Verrucomicrobiota bacterium]|jgi:hypothetical protein